MARTKKYFSKNKKVKNVRQLRKNKSRSRKTRKQKVGNIIKRRSIRKKQKGVHLGGEGKRRVNNITNIIS